MSAIAILVAFGLLISGVNALVAAINLKRYRPAPHINPDNAPRTIAICIPARNEAANIGHAIQAALASVASTDLAIVLVHDDDSTDGTADLVEHASTADPRVVLVRSEALPAGWNGKQHGCWRLAQHAIELGATHLLFTDADVRLEPHGASRAALAFDTIHAARKDAGLPDLGLLSAFPRQRTGTLGEALQVPMMFFLLLSYLPMGRMRNTLDPAASAACGQFIMLTADAYTATGGHATVRASMHEGVMLPREVRKAGLGTDLIDGTDLAHVRMYRGFTQSWQGFSKNAYEGVGSIPLLVILSILNIVGHVAPPIVAAYALTGMIAGTTNPAEWWAWGALLATAVGIGSRLSIASRLRHSIAGALLHPVGVALMVAVQWWSLWLDKRGKRSWRGRVATDPGQAVA